MFVCLCVVQNMGGRRFRFCRRKRRVRSTTLRSTKQQRTERKRNYDRTRREKQRRLVTVCDDGSANKDDLSPSSLASSGPIDIRDLFARIRSLQRARDKYRRLWNIEHRKAIALDRDLKKLLYEYSLLESQSYPVDEDYDAGDDEDRVGDQVLSLSIEHVATSTSLITEKTFDPKFARSFRNYMKIRLYCRVLKNTKALYNLERCFDIYDIVRGQRTKTFDLGGYSPSTLSRLMQFRALQLFRFETVIVIKAVWKPGDSTITLHHDEASYKGDAWMSVILVFDAKEPTIDEAADPTVFTPELRCGNAVRAIWHQKIPGKDAQTTVDLAVCPAVDYLDQIGCVMYGEDWELIRDRLKKRMATMSDQNSTALLTNKLIAKEFGVEDLIELVCLMHNLDNTLICAEQRLLAQRQDSRNRGDVLRNNFNINILEIANRIQNHLMIRCDTDKNKGDAFEHFFANSSNRSSFTPFQRVIGGRRQHLAINVEAVLSRREEIAKFGSTTFSGKFLTTNPRLLFEYGTSQILLRESLVFLCLCRNFVTPMISTIGKDCQLMKNVLPKMKESLVNLAAVATNTKFAVRSLLTMTKMFSGMSPHILSNKMLSETAKVAIIDSTNNFSGVQAFYNNATSLFRRNGISFQDKYFHHLFSQSLEQFQWILKQYQGVCDVVQMDMHRRYSLQSSSAIPSSSFGTNDCCETLNATGKYHEKRAPNISEGAKAALAVHDVNCGKSWYTFDHLAEHQPAEFQYTLMAWDRFCGTFKQSHSEKIQYQKKYKKVKRVHLTSKLNKPVDAVPVAKAMFAKSKLKSVICTALCSSHPVWKEWTSMRDKYLEKNKGMLVSAQRRGLREILRPFMRLKKTHRASFIKTKGLETLQKALHQYCEQYNAQRSNGMLSLPSLTEPQYNNRCPPLPSLHD